MTVSPGMFFMCTTGMLFPSKILNRFDWVGPAWLADPLVLTRQVAFAKCLCQHVNVKCVNVPAPIAFSVVFNNALYCFISPEADA